MTLSDADARHPWLVHPPGRLVRLATTSRNAEGLGVLARAVLAERFDAGDAQMMHDALCRRVDLPEAVTVPLRAYARLDELMLSWPASDPESASPELVITRAVRPAAWLAFPDLSAAALACLVSAIPYAAARPDLQASRLIFMTAERGLRGLLAALAFAEFLHGEEAPANPATASRLSAARRRLSAALDRLTPTTLGRLVLSPEEGSVRVFSAALSPQAAERFVGAGLPGAAARLNMLHAAPPAWTTAQWASLLASPDKATRLAAAALRAVSPSPAPIEPSRGR
jgi:hypothetical protein